MDKTFYNSRFFINFFLALLLFILYFNPFQNNKIVNFDNEMTVETLKDVNSLEKYFSLRKKYKIYDIAPVSDLSHIIDIKISKSTNLNVGIIQNVFIWFAILLCALSLIKKRLEYSVAIVLTILLATHPLIVQVIMWVSARKHLLAALFILLSLIQLEKFLKNSRKFNGILSFFFYVLSIFSWPISVLIALPFIFKIASSSLSKNYKRIYSFSIFILMSLCLNLNYKYYNLKGAKFVDSFSPEISLNGIGRSFFQIIIPNFFANTYEEFSLYNQLGLILFALYGYFYFKKESKKEFNELIMFFLAPLLVVLMIPTILFVLDCYILIPAIFIFIYFPKIKPTKLFFSISMLILTFFIIKSISEIKIHQNRDVLVNRSYKEENTCTNIGMYVMDSWHHGNWEVATTNYYKFLEKQCVKLSLSQVYLYTLYLDNKLTALEKTNVIEKVFKRSILGQLIIIQLSTDTKLAKLGKTIEKLKMTKSNVARTPFGPQNDPVFAELNFYCKQNILLKTCQDYEENLNRVYIKNTSFETQTY